jgi:preprotein translocase subunit YajC
VPDLCAPIFLAQDAIPTTPAPGSAPASMDGSTGAPGTPDSGGSGGGGGGLFSNPLLLVLIFVVFYLLLIRPQSKEKKKREALLQSLKKGDRVVMTSGIHGEIIQIDEKTTVVEIDDGVRVKFDRAAIWQPETLAAAPAADAKPAAGAKGKPA